MASAYLVMRNLTVNSRLHVLVSLPCYKLSDGGKEELKIARWHGRGELGRMEAACIVNVPARNEEGNKLKTVLIFLSDHNRIHVCARRSSRTVSVAKKNSAL